MNAIWQGLAMGIGATLALDLWAQLLKRTGGIASTDWSVVGRWFVGIVQGRLVLATGEPTAHADYGLALGWLVHYGVGLGYAFAYLALLQLSHASVSLYSAAVFGLVTLLSPWLILQPCLGMGFFASATPRPNLTRGLNVVAHLMFGVGLYLSWQVVNLVGSLAQLQ